MASIGSSFGEPRSQLKVNEKPCLLLVQSCSLSTHLAASVLHIMMLGSLKKNKEYIDEFVEQGNSALVISFTKTFNLSFCPVLQQEMALTGCRKALLSGSTVQNYCMSEAKRKNLWCGTFWEENGEWSIYGWLYPKAGLLQSSPLPAFPPKPEKFLARKQYKPLASVMTTSGVQV